MMGASELRSEGGREAWKRGRAAWRCALVARAKKIRGTTSTTKIITIIIVVVVPPSCCPHSSKSLPLRACAGAERAS